MKHLTGLTFIDIIITLILVIFMLVLPKLFDRVFPNNKSSERIEGNFESWLKQNNNKMYYIVEKAKSSAVSLTQYVSFYMYVNKGGKQQFVNISDLLPSFLSSTLSGSQFFKGTHNKLNGTWEFTDFNIVEFSNKLSSKYGNVELVRIDKTYLS